MLTSVPLVLSLLLLVLESILSPSYGKDIGQTCVVDNSIGICKPLHNCQKVYQEFLTGKTPSETCGFLDFVPIVCCPRITSVEHLYFTEPTPTSQSETTAGTNTPRPLKLDGSRGSLARAKCAENAEAVFAFTLPSTPTLNQEPVNTSLCALTTKKLKLGGGKAEAKEFPHMAAIGFHDNDAIEWACGGSLISAKIVMTGAVCTETLNWGSAKWVRLGDLNLAQTNDDAMPQTIAIKEAIRHPDYKPPSYYHDIAILRLEEEATYNAYVRPACLPVDWPDVGGNNKAVATGWGTTDWGGTSSKDLMRVTVNFVSYESCNASYNSTVNLKLGIVDEWHICAGELGLGTCQGDGGGPLAIFNTDHQCMYTVIGITSFGRFCGSTTPDVYTRVYHYIPWIERTAWPEYFQDID